MLYVRPFPAAHPSRNIVGIYDEQFPENDGYALVMHIDSMER